MKKPNPKAKEDPREVPVGTFRLACHNVRVVMDFELAGGDFASAPEDKGAPIIRVGASKTKGWKSVLSYLLHESMEAVLAWENRRLIPDDGWGSNHADYIFHFDHNGFTRACEQVAYFMADVVPAMHAIWGKRRGERKRRK